MAEDTTNGVSDEKDVQAADKKEEIVDERSEMMDQIDQGNKAQDVKDALDMGIDPPEVSEEEPVKKVEADPQKPVEPVTEEEMVTLKVYGQEKQVTKAEALKAGIASLQKESAADKMLRDAADKKKEAEELLEKAKTAPTDEKEEPEHTWADAIEELQYGDKDKAAEMFNNLTSQPGNTQPQVTPEEISKMIDTKSAQTKHDDKIYDLMESDYSEILSDPHLMNVTKSIASAKEAAGDTRDTLEFYTEVFTEAYEWKGIKPGQKNIETKKNKKKLIDTVRGVNTTEPAETVSDLTPEEQTSKTIQEMAEARGQL